MAVVDYELITAVERDSKWAKGFIVDEGFNFSRAH
jgi:hypothetical protein